MSNRHQVDVVIGMPSYRMPFDDLEDYMSFRNLLAYSHNAGLRIQDEYGSGTDLVHNRNVVVEKALQCGATWVLQIDTDMVYPPDGLLRLIKRGCKVIGGLYFGRKRPYFNAICGMLDESADSSDLPPTMLDIPERSVERPKGFVNRLKAFWDGMSGPDHQPPMTQKQIHRTNDEEIIGYRSLQWDRPEEMTGIRKVDAVGTGFMLIHTSVLRKLDQPYFAWKEIPGRAKGLGEDYNFCRKAIAAGFEVYVDLDLKLGHIGTYNYTWRDHFLHKGIRRAAAAQAAAQMPPTRTQAPPARIIVPANDSGNGKRIIVP